MSAMFKLVFWFGYYLQTVRQHFYAGVDHCRCTDTEMLIRRRLADGQREAE